MAISRNVYSLLTVVLTAATVSGMFFTDSKENDYPRIGKRCRTSSPLYNNLLCRDGKLDEYPTGNSVIKRPDIASILASSLYGQLNKDTDGLDSSEDIYTPTDVRPYRQNLSQGMSERVRQYLKSLQTDYDTA